MTGFLVHTPDDGWTEVKPIEVSYETLYQMMHMGWSSTNSRGIQFVMPENATYDEFLVAWKAFRQNG